MMRKSVNSNLPAGRQGQKSKIRNSGFTLVEVLVTFAIVSVVVTIGSISFFSLLRGANKTEILKEVKQNGDYALSVMEIRLRNARDVLSGCDGSVTNSFTIENPDATTTTFSCINTGSAQQIREETGATTTYLSGPQVTVATDCATAAITSLMFSCNLSVIDGVTKNVSLGFTLKQANSDSPLTETAQQTFSTQVTLRNN